MKTPETDSLAEVGLEDLKKKVQEILARWEAHFQGEFKPVNEENMDFSMRGVHLAITPTNQIVAAFVNYETALSFASFEGDLELLKGYLHLLERKTPTAEGSGPNLPLLPPSA